MDSNQGGLKFHRTILEQVLKLLTPAERRRWAWIVMLVIFNALLDFFSVAAFLPLLFLVVRPESLTGDSLIARLYSSIGFSSAGQFIVAFSGGLLLLILI